MKKIGRTIRRRRREGKTDYKLRFGMLKSGRPRLVIRRTNKYFIGQIITSDVAQDKVVASAHSKELLNHGWSKDAAGSLKSRGAAYLTGYLLASKYKGKEQPILDIGLARSIAGSRTYAFLKGAVDGGMNVAHSEAILPSDEIMSSSEKGHAFIEKVKGGIK